MLSRTTYNAKFPDDFPGAHDSIALAIDGDHAGGPYFKVNTDPTLEEQHELLGRAQYYVAIARTVSGPTLDQGNIRLHVGTSWTTMPPYGDGGGSVFGEAPVISVIEAYVTPYDSWVGWEGEEIEISQLASGKVIGFGIAVYDYDPGEEWRPAWTPGLTPDAGYSPADNFADSFLLGPDGSVPNNSAVEMDSWARIKASLKEK